MKTVTDPCIQSTRTKVMRGVLTLFLCAFLSLTFLNGCTSVKVQDYQNATPTLLIEDYFQGDVKAWGVFQDRFGKVRRTFDVDIVGTWDEDTQTLKLVEDFVYDDGETEQRIWTITKTDENTYKGFADGVIGEAEGKSAGNAFNFKYDFNLPVNGKIWKVSFDDWMYLQSDKILFNKATIKRWGFRLGDVYIFFDKRPNQ